MADGCNNFLLDTVTKTKNGVDYDYDVYDCGFRSYRRTLLRGREESLPEILDMVFLEEDKEEEIHQEDSNY
jgi:hypothetical protein